MWCPYFNFFPYLKGGTILKLAVMPDPVDFKVVPGNRTPAFVQELRLSKAEGLGKCPLTWLYASQVILM